MGTLFDGKSLLIVTGTTRGLGQEIVKQFSENLQDGSHFVLISKSSELKSKTEELKKQFPKLVYYAFNCDLSQLDDVMKLGDNLVAGFGDDLLASVDNLAIIHNSGSIGQIDKGCEDLTDGSKLQSYTNLNFNSMVLLNAAFLRLKKKSSNKNLRSLIINMSSAVGVIPFANMTQVCSIKAARDMSIRVLSLEHPDVRTLNFAPGMVETDMMAEVRDSWTSERMSGWSLITTVESVNKLVKCVRANTFVNASHVDVSEV